MVERVGLIGGGNWGSAISTIIGKNVLKYNEFQSSVLMWVFEEKIDDKNLTDIINSEHENIKYLKGIRLPDNIIADPNLENVVNQSTLLVFVIPHQFVVNVCHQIKNFIRPEHRAISLIKGFEINENDLTPISKVINGILNIDVSVLMGANIASEVASGLFAESTLGYRNESNKELFLKLFNTPSFKVKCTHDIIGVELCGALKNIVAIAAGICDGLKQGQNTKASIIRIGLMEMINFSKKYSTGVDIFTFFESCGIADLIATCYAGRNRRIAEKIAETGKSPEELEKEFLNGQKLQGSLTSKEVYQFLKSRNDIDNFPLFTSVYRICYEKAPCTIIYSST